jgi:hypothetical protein
MTILFHLDGNKTTPSCFQSAEIFKVLFFHKSVFLVIFS